MKEDLDTQRDTIGLFIRSILDDMDKVSKSTRKIDMMAYMDAWRTDLLTIQYILDL